jgi:predicted dehydrogenase
LRVVADLDMDRARRAGAALGCAFTASWRQAVERSDVDAVIVSTSTRALPEVSLAALETGKHVLCEKPFGRCAAEVWPAVEAAEHHQLCLKIGYNHRYHPALRQAYAMFRGGAIGRLHFLRCVYGHGGRPGYDREWRTQPELAGGGQLLDQGVHALDLFQWFAGEFAEVKAYSSTAFWPIAPLEDNIFALLRCPSGCLASLHASWTEWKNSFRFEVFGEEGYLTVRGLGGAYGSERLCHGIRRGLGKCPEENFFAFPGPDQSLEQEWEDFLDCIEQGRIPPSSGRSGWQTLQLADCVYRAAREPGAAPSEIYNEPVALLPAHCAGENRR